MSIRTFISRLLVAAVALAAVNCGGSSSNGEDTIGPNDVVVGFTQTTLQTPRAKPFNIVVKLNKAASADVVLELSMTGAAPFSEVGFNGLKPDGTTELTIPAGETVGSIAATANLTSDTARTIVFHLNSVKSGGAKVDPAAKQLTVTVGGTSSNGATISLSAFNQVAGEGASLVASVSIASNALITTDITVHFTLTGTATSGTDYTASASSEIVIPAGQTTGSVTITPINDTEVEVFSETVILTVTSVNGGELAAGTQPVVITITDDEAMTLTPSEAEVTLAEGGTHEVTLTLPTTFDRKAEVSVISDTRGRAPCSSSPASPTASSSFRRGRRPQSSPSSRSMTARSPAATPRRSASMASSSMATRTTRTTRSSVAR